MIEEILSKRTNHSFFREDKIPEKKVIENILEQAHKLTPHKIHIFTSPKGVVLRGNQNTPTPT